MNTIANIEARGVCDHVHKQEPDKKTFTLMEKKELTYSWKITCGLPASNVKRD